MLTDRDAMPFGKYRGQPMERVPASYLDWLHGQDWIREWPDVVDYIERNRDVIDSELGDT
jgi:hypothetical protein